MMISAQDFLMYLGRRGATWDPERQVVGCTRCSGERPWPGTIGWHRCPRGRNDWLDAHPASAMAARRLDAYPPIPYPPLVLEPATAPPTAPLLPAADSAPQRRRGRPAGSGRYNLEDVRNAIRALWDATGSHPSRDAVATYMHIAKETLDDTIRRESERSGQRLKPFWRHCLAVAGVHAQRAIARDTCEQRARYHGDAVPPRLIIATWATVGEA